MVCANVNYLSGTLFELAVRGGFNLYPPPGAHATSYVQYVVQPGDTIDAIIAANNLYGAYVYVGQTLNVPVTTPVTTYPGAAYATASAQAGSASASAGFYYTVRSGDTLYLIASRCSVTVEVIRTVNNLYSGFVYPGQVLWIPYGSTPSYNVTTSGYGYGYGTASASASSGPGYAYASASTGGPDGGRYYIVRTGDTLFRIALNHGSSVEAIRAANGIYGNWIYPGQQLIIP